jgi:RimJ/RimL family protein N-acetyltransferase
LRQVCLLVQDVEESLHPEIGYLIHRPLWRRGYATEAALATREFAFGFMQLPYVLSMIRPENIPSRGVAAKLGMRPLRDVHWRGFVTTIFRVENANQTSKEWLAADLR